MVYPPHLTASRLIPRTILILIASMALASMPASAQLRWGANGAGGDGIWNPTGLNWWNGNSNVPWTGGEAAIFEGTSGVVTVQDQGYPGHVVSDLIFNVPGYRLTSGSIVGSPNGLSISANADAEIASSLNPSLANITNSVLTKTGAGKLTLTGFNSFRQVAVQSGELVAGAGSNFFVTSVNVQDSAILTIADSDPVLLEGVTGSGIIRPNNVGGTFTISLFSAGSLFGGSLQDNGVGVLGLSISHSKPHVFTGTNSHSGFTTVSGVLVLSGEGSMRNTSLSIFQPGLARIDNVAVPGSDRISDAKPIFMTGGTLEYVGNSTTPVVETAGALTFRGAAHISMIDPSGTANRLVLQGFNRGSDGVISISGAGLMVSGSVPVENGIIGAYAIAGNEWATAEPDGRITALSNYSSGFLGGSAEDNVKLSGSEIVSLASPTVRNSLNLQGPSGGGVALDLAGHSLTLSSGGLLSSGGEATISNGSIAASSQELIITARNTLNIAAAIGETTAGTSLLKVGNGDLVLSGSNTYTGPTILLEGSVIVSSDSNLGLGNAIKFRDGTLVAAASFSTTKSISMQSGGNEIGAIDTRENNVVVSGSLSGARIYKDGTGTLTLPTMTAGSVYIREGTLELLNPTAGAIYMHGGNLRAKGTIASLLLEMNVDSTLDIGGPAAATLTSTRYFRLTGHLTIDFGIGSAGSDLWRITDSVSYSHLAGSRHDGSIIFRFDDLGGIATGTPYTVISHFAGFTLPASTFALSPENVAKGWSASFSSSPGTVRVTFAQVPEPGSAATMIACLALGISLLRLRGI